MEATTTKYLSDSDINEFNRRYKETLLELESKRKLLKEKTDEVLNLASEKTFLQQELDKELQEKNYIQKQLNEMKTISRQREDEWSNFRDNWAQNKIKFEISNKTADALKTQISNQQQEISQLKANKEELERQIRDNLIWKEKCSATHKKVECVVETFARQFRNVEQEHLKLDSATKAALSLASKADQAKNNYEKSLKLLTKENQELKKKVTEITMQLEEMKLRVKNNCAPKSNTVNAAATTEILNEWKEYHEVKYKDVESNFEKIKHMYDCIAQLQGAEQAALNTVKELEKRLQEQTESNKKPEVQDCEIQVTTVSEETPNVDDNKCIVKDQIANSENLEA